MDNSFGKTLVAIRKEHKLTQKQVALMAGVSQQCVSEWESGKMEPTLSNLWKLADALDLSIDVLVGRREY
ncbi:MAG: helix-turn-helix domain-containing protein [Candidatus Coproplasma sp.]